MTTFACPFGCGQHEYPRECRAADSGLTPAEYDDVQVRLQAAKHAAEMVAAGIKFDPDYVKHPRIADAQPQGPLADAAELSWSKLREMIGAAKKQTTSDDKIKAMMFGSPGAGKTTWAAAPPGGPAVVMDPIPNPSMMVVRAMDQYGQSIAMYWDDASKSWKQAAVVTCGGCDAEVPEHLTEPGALYRGKPVCVDCNELFLDVGSSLPWRAASVCSDCQRVTDSMQLTPQAVVGKDGKIMRMGSVCPACRVKP